MSAKWPEIPTEIKGALVHTPVRLSPPGFDMEALDVQGLYDTTQDPPVLYVGNWLPEYIKWHTFIHELLHKLERDADLILVDKAEEDDDPTGKNVYDRLATAFLVTWRLNNWKLPGE